MNRPATPATAPSRTDTWVLLRGLTRGQGHWGQFPQTLLAALPPGTRLLTPDLPGNGLLHRQRSPASVRQMAESVRAQLRDEGHAPPYRVLAMSLGAMVTVAWAHAHPDEIACGVLINTSLRPHSPFWQRLQPAQYPIIARLLLTQAAGADWEQAIMHMTTRHPGDRAALLQYWLALREAQPVDTRNGLRQLWAATRYRAPLAVPPVPLLLLGSAGDQLVNPACSRTLARSWSADLRWHPTAGHDLPQDDGAWVAQQVADWLALGTPSSPAVSG